MRSRLCSIDGRRVLRSDGERSPSLNTLCTALLRNPDTLQSFMGINFLPAWHSACLSKCFLLPCTRWLRLRQYIRRGFKTWANRFGGLAFCGQSVSA